MSLVNSKELTKAEIEYIKKLEIKNHFNEMLIGIESIIYYRDLVKIYELKNILSIGIPYGNILDHELENVLGNALDMLLDNV